MHVQENYWINDCAEKHLFPSQKIYIFHLFDGFYHFGVNERDNRKYYYVYACVIMEDILIYIFYVFEDI